MKNYNHEYEFITSKEYRERYFPYYKFHEDFLVDFILKNQLKPPQERIRYKVIDGVLFIEDKK